MMLDNRKMTHVKVLLAMIIVVAACNRNAKHGVPVAGQKVMLSTSQWKRMTNEFDYAENFEATTNRPPRKSQVLTVFKIRMSKDRRNGKEIARDEYLEIFCTGPSQIAVGIRRDHGPYWLLSREVFSGVADCEPGQYFTGDEFDRISSILRNEIDTTRNQLGETRLVP